MRFELLYTVSVLILHRDSFSSSAITPCHVLITQNVAHASESKGCACMMRTWLRFATERKKKTKPEFQLGRSLWRARVITIFHPNLLQGGKSEAGREVRSTCGRPVKQVFLQYKITNCPNTVLDSRVICSQCNWMIKGVITWTHLRHCTISSLYLTHLVTALCIVSIFPRYFRQLLRSSELKEFFCLKQGFQMNCGWLI